MNVEILCANCSQAKGRVERANRTPQDRSVKDLRLLGICDIAAANVFLSGFTDRYNARFANVAGRTDNRRRALIVEPERLRDVFCLRDQR